jgi:hypothetical protein
LPCYPSFLLGLVRAPVTPTPKAPGDVLNSFHTADWWANQSPLTRLAIVAVAVGLLVLLAAVGWGIRRRWRRLSGRPHGPAETTRAATR